ncbi:MAG: SusC/RagA family TonB-linked outer membrane protein [Gemmatimonadales bacterium]|nr:SusC/RagA family TonB-linked outer membrane protein [Gemmatimonadales bacterium]
MRVPVISRARLSAWTLAVAASAALAGPLLAQAGTISGTVTDQATGRPIPGARIQATTQQVFAITNQQGQYTLRGLTAGAHTLRTFMLGYASETRSVTAGPGAETIDWALRSVPFQLEEIVTTATGDQQSRELGNSVSKIQAGQLVETAPTTNMAQVLSGRVAGVSVLQSAGTSGTGARIRVRGLSSVSLSNDPLLYIDGVRVASDAPAGAFVGGASVSKLNNLNPEEIESIEIVKGPSAATLYGTQAANGVIRVTTKRGRAGGSQWNAWLEGGMLKDGYTYPKVYFNASAENPNSDCLTYMAAAGTCTIANRYELDLLNDPRTTPFATGFRQQVGASLSGGSDLIRYFVSAEGESETGVLKLGDAEGDYAATLRGLASRAELPREQVRPNHFNKYNFRVNLNAAPRSNLDVSLSTGYVINNIRLPQTGDNFSSLISSPIFGSANPNIVAITGGYGFSRPAHSIGEVSWRKNDHFINAATVNWRPFSWLSTRGTFGIDYLNYVDEQNILRGQGCLTCTTENQGKRMFNRYIDTKYTVDLNATAQTQLTSRIGSKTAVGAQFNRDKLFAVLAQADILPPGVISLSAGAQQTLTEATTDVITLGTYVEQQLSFDNRLYLTGALRVDDNSAFGSAARSAYYPKVSASIVAIDGADGPINSLRFRGAFGATGQSPRPLDALTYQSPVTATIFGQASVPAVTLGGLGDPNLKPERSREIEAGFDLALLGSRLGLEVTFYDKRTSDALVLRQQPYSLGGVATRLENVGVVSNRGIEISVNTRLIDGRDLAWDLQLEAAGNRNRLVRLADGVPPIAGFGFQNIPDYPMFGLWWPGLVGFADANGDGAISPDEVEVTSEAVFHGSTVPTRNLAANTSLALFNNRVRVGAQVDYRGGYVTHNVNDMFMCAFQVNCRALHDPTASLEEQAAAIAGPMAFGAYAQNAEHVRLREASITYTLSNTLARSLGAKTANLTLTGRNLWLKTFGFTSWDPENVTGSADAANYNFSAQRQPVVGMLRVNLTF